MTNFAVGSGILNLLNSPAGDGLSKRHVTWQLDSMNAQNIFLCQFCFFLYQQKLRKMSLARH